MAAFEDLLKKPGLFAGALGLGGQLVAGREADKYQRGVAQSMAGAAQPWQTAAQGQLTLGAQDPTVMAAERFRQQQALIAPGQEAAFQRLQRELLKSGQGGIASYAPTEGGVGGTGTAINPQTAAFYAAQEQARNQAAYGAQAEADKRIDQLLNRAGMLQGVAGEAQFQQRARTPARRPSALETILGGGAKMLSNPKALEGFVGMLGKGADWLSGLGQPNVNIGAPPVDMSWMRRIEMPTFSAGSDYSWLA